MLAKQLFAFVLLGCVALSYQWCYTYHCPHHSTLRDCLQGTWTCGADEFCNVKTHLNHGNAPWVVLDCQPKTQIGQCLESYAANSDQCDANKHDRVCSWCCEDDVCVKSLASGVYFAPANVTIPAAPVDTTPMPPTTVPLMSTTTTPPPPACTDVYLGDCATDFAGRCSEALVQQLCMATCQVDCNAVGRK